jgi:hypothetical protein
MTEPLTPIDLDLRDFGFMPLEVVRLRDSDLAALATGDEFRAAVLLWCAAWHQVPAASLPNDERLLAKLAGFGRDLKGWKNVASEALRGFVECTDGRLYHPVIADIAIESGGKKTKQKSKTSKATEARIRKAEERRNEKRNDDRDGSRNEVQGRGEEGNGEDRREEADQEVAQTQSTALTIIQPDLLAPAKPVKKQRAASKAPLAHDWKLSDEDWNYAAEKGFPAPKIDLMAEAFRSNHLGKGTMMANPSGYWRTWVLNEIKWHGVPGRQGAAASPASFGRPRSTDTALEGIFDGMGGSDERDR